MKYIIICIIFLTGCSTTKTACEAQWLEYGRALQKGADTIDKLPTCRVPKWL